MATITVKPDGSGDYTTIEAAHDAGSSHDTIQIYSGIYNESWETFTSKGPYTYEAAAGHRVVLSGSGTGTGFFLKSYYQHGNRFHNLEFTGYAQPLVGVGIGNLWHMSGCFIYDCGGTTATTLTLGGTSSANPATIDSCKIFNDNGIAVQLGAYIPGATYGGYAKITNSLIVSNAANHSPLQSSTTYPSITASFCTVIGSTTNDALIDQVPQVRNCIVSGTYTGGTPGAAGYNGTNGIRSDDSKYNVVAVDQWAFVSGSSGTGHLGGGTLEEGSKFRYRGLDHYFTSPGTLGSYNTGSDDYTLLKNRTLQGKKPVAYYSMSDGSGTQITDSSTLGYNLHGELTGTDGTNPTWDSTEKKLGSYSLEFAGAEDFVKIPNLCMHISGTNFSTFMWIKTALDANKYFWSVDSTNDAGTSELLFGSHSFADNLTFFDGGSATARDVASDGLDTTINDDEWHFVGFTFNNTSKLVRLWVDGHVDGEATFHDDCEIVAGNVFTLGAQQNMMWAGARTYSDWWTGNIDELSFWDSILEEEHILELYNNGEGMNAANGVGTCIEDYRNPALEAGIQWDNVHTDLPGNVYRPDAANLTWKDKAFSMASGSLDSCMGVINDLVPDAGAYEAPSDYHIGKILGVKT